MKTFKFVLFLVLTFCDDIWSNEKQDFIKLAEEISLTAVMEEVKTADNYILNMFHIPGHGEPIFLQHGLFDSSNTFILRENNSLSAVLARAGYDIWLGNFRGNKYSRSHVFLNPDIDKEFWNFTMHEHSIYDIPAMVDQVLKKTRRNELIAIGHSEGNAVFYALGSSKTEYNDKIKVLIALAPVCFLHHIPAPISSLIKISPIINSVLKNLGTEELFRDIPDVNLLYSIMCSKIAFTYDICTDFGFGTIYDTDEVELEKEFLENKIAIYYPSATSRRNLNHLAQIALAKKFQKYDYGLLENYKKYGSMSPPEYDLSKITMKVELLVGKNDKLATIDDVKILKDKLKNNNYREIDKINHGHFIWGKNMDKYIYNEIFDILRDL